ncbi:NAD(P)/FAD-dependent oxidoreductase [soil metagenome]
MDIAVIGSGISGLSSAWLLSGQHRVTLFEQEKRAGGHSNTVDVPTNGADLPVDTGFIVYNEATYPNLTALFAHLEVPTKASDMSFAVSLDDGALEYSGTDLKGLFAQRGNLVNLRFWAMLRDLVRFYRSAPADADTIGLMSLDQYLTENGYGDAFRHDHLYPMAAAIWSTPAEHIGRYPVASFVRFCENHSLLKLAGRPAWRTVDGGSRQYVQRLKSAFKGDVRLDSGVQRVDRLSDHVVLTLVDGSKERFDKVVVATHADQALRLLDSPSALEQRVLGAFTYTQNRAVLHRDERLMPKRRRVWSSWNYASRRKGADPALCVTYWMNRLQGIDDATPLFVTLNPIREPAPAQVIRSEVYDHPVFDAAAIRAQQQLWTLQGMQNTWYCGAYFGSGFHEDGLQSGLAVAEALGGVRRPWTVIGESDRIVLPAAVALAS